NEYGFGVQVPRFSPTADQKHDAIDADVERLEQHQGKQEERLIFYDESRDATLGVDLLFAEREDRKVDVGIEVQVIGITVVSVVFIDPPAATHGKE
ncbi:MAG: hypothetical protein O7F09_02195, partial [Chloroflexi bacterium]|nr:hypothetical protein [Chloroflexota bacterium]